MYYDCMFIQIHHDDMHIFLILTALEFSRRDSLLGNDVNHSSPSGQSISIDTCQQGLCQCFKQFFWFLIGLVEGFAHAVQVSCTRS